MQSGGLSLLSSPSISGVMAKRSFSPELLESLRSMVVTKALDALGLHWKRDPYFQPVKDAATLRLHVAVVDILPHLRASRLRRGIPITG